MELKDFKVGQAWRRRDGEQETIEYVMCGSSRPIWTKSGTLRMSDGRWDDVSESRFDLVELVKDVDEPPTQTRLDAQLAGAMQASRGATSAELALFDAIVVAAMAPGCTNVNEYIYSVLQLRRKLEQDISQ